jgi:hypothetical protein
VGVAFLAKLLSHLVTFIKLSGEPIEFESEGLDLETKQARSQAPPFSSLVSREEDVKLHALKGVASR